VDVVDGQQRSTTSCLYLGEIIRALISNCELDYTNDISECLYSGAAPKLTLNNDTGDIFYDLLKAGRPNIAAQNPQVKTGHRGDHRPWRRNKRKISSERFHLTRPRAYI
jgi:hypothetical protein